MTLTAINLGFHFILELCALAAIVYWGFRTGDSLMLKLLLGIGVPFVAAIVWGVFRVPNDPGKATVAVSGPVRLVIEAAIMGLAVWCLAAAGQTTLAWVMGIAVVVNYTLMYNRLIWLWHQR